MSRRRRHDEPQRQASDHTTPEAFRSGMRSKALRSEKPATSTRHPRHAVEAVLEIHDLLRPGVTARGAFLDLVGIVERTFPLHAMTLLTKDGQRPSTWVARDSGVSADALEALGVVVLRYFDGVGTLDELEVAVEAMRHRCLTLPIADDDGTVRGLLCVAPRGESSEEALAFLSFVARHLAAVVGRELRVAAEAEGPSLVGAYRAALEAVRDRDHVLAMVSHDLKNPLGIILMNAARILESTPEVDRRQRGRRQVEAIQRSAKRMLQLVGDLLDLEAMEAGQLSVRPSVCDLARIVSEAVRDFGPRASAARITLRGDVADALPRVWADEHRIMQVLANLIGNALEFTTAGGHIVVTADVFGDDAVVVSVADDGRGIRADDLPHVFDRFWQAAGSARSGSGLGLAICKSIVERGGGRIWAESGITPGACGTKVTFTLRASGDGTVRGLPSR